MNLYKLNKIINLIVLFIMFSNVYIKIGPLGTGIMIASAIIYYFIYNIFITCSRPVISKMIASRLKRGFDDNAKKVLTNYFYYTIFISVIVFVLFFLIPEFLCNVLYKNTLCSTIFTICSFVFFIHAICDTLKAYYVGCSDSKILIISDLFKNAVLVITSFFLLSYFVDYGTKVGALKNAPIMEGVYGATGVVIAFAISYIIEFLVLLSGMKRIFKKDEFSFNEVRSKESYRTFLKSFIPSLLKKMRTGVFPILSFLLISIIYIRKSTGEIENVYINLAVLMIPIVLISVVAIMLLKEFSYIHIYQIKAAYKKEDRKSIIYAFTNYANAVFVLAIPMFITLVTFSKAICMKLYSLELENLTSLCIIAAFVFLLAALDTIFTCGLEALNIDDKTGIVYLIGFVIQMFFMLLAAKSGITTTKILVSFLLYYLICLFGHGFLGISEIGLKYNECLAKLIKISIASIPMLVIDIILANFLSMNFIIILISIIIGYSLFCLVFSLIHGYNAKELKSLEGSFLYYYLKLFAGIFHIR